MLAGYIIHGKEGRKKAEEENKNISTVCFLGMHGY